MHAPNFRTSDLFGEPVDLDALRGRPVLLSFFRNAACAMCNLRVRHLIRRYPDLNAEGLQVIAVFESAPDALRKYVGRQDAPFPIVGDPEATLYDLYGVQSSEAKVDTTMAMAATGAVIAEAAENGFELVPEPGSNFTRMPADFLIGADGVILKAHYADFVWDHMPFDTVEALLSAAIAA
jgi:peroxiredoxin